MDRRPAQTAHATPHPHRIDDKDTREMFMLGLPALGFEVTSVGDAAQAYSRAWQAHPDIPSD
jgi:hypothetical protein